jgi:hypothetical protein
LSPHAGGADRRVLVSTSGNGGSSSKQTSRKKKSGDDGEPDCDDASRSLGCAEQAVVDFLGTRAPVLIISYEGFRKYATMLNGEGRVANRGVEMIVCDEGHRLKNSAGSKTLECLAASPAYYRLLLSGTPVQVGQGSFGDNPLCLFVVLP